MPGAKELSTCEWHSAQVIPTRTRTSSPPMVSTVPCSPDRVLHRLRERVGVDLGAEGECERRAHRTLDDLVQARGIGPEDFVAVGIVAEDLFSLRDQGRIERPERVAVVL